MQVVHVKRYMRGWRDKCEGGGMLKDIMSGTEKPRVHDQSKKGQQDMKATNMTCIESFVTTIVITKTIHAIRCSSTDTRRLKIG